MRDRDKQLDGRDLVRQTDRQRARELEKPDARELPEELQPEDDRESEHRSRVIDVMRRILDREHVVVDEQPLSARELEALDALQAAVEGRDGAVSQFVYASDRRDLLEHALAVLQPNFVIGDEHHAQLLGDYRDLIERIGVLRSGLVELEDAQDDLLMANTEVASIRTDADQDDDPDAESGSTPSTLTGPERKAEPKPPTSLNGPEREAEPKPPTSLTGPEVKPVPKPPSSLGDAKELEAAHKKPWWKRVLG